MWLLTFYSCFTVSLAYFNANGENAWQNNVFICEPRITDTDRNVSIHTLQTFNYRSYKIMTNRHTWLIIIWPGLSYFVWFFLCRLIAVHHRTPLNPTKSSKCSFLSRTLWHIGYSVTCLWCFFSLFLGSLNFPVFVFFAIENHSIARSTQTHKVTKGLSLQWRRPRFFAGSALRIPHFSPTKSGFRGQAVSSTFL